MEDSTLCGLFNWRPKFLQPLATQKAYLLVYSLLGIIQGMSSSYLSSCLSTIEKQFGVTSSDAAWTFSGNEVCQILFIFLLPFLSKIKKRTKWTSITLVVSAIGMLMCALPFLLKNKDEYKDGWNVQHSSASPLCIPGEDDKKHCTANSVYDWYGLLSIFLGFFFVGFGTSFFHSFGIPYIDDNTSKKNSPLTLGIASASRMLGPTLGYILGSACLAIYVDPGADVDLVEGDKGWLGAWWLGFIVIAVLLVTIAPFLALFPERLPGDQNTDAFRASQNAPEQELNSFTSYWTDTKERVIRLGRNKVYVYSSLSTLSFLLAIVGFGTFIPKMFQYVFGQPASSSGSVTGLSKALLSAIGMIGSGYVIGRFRFTARTLQTWNVVVGFIMFILITAVFQIQCPVELSVYRGACNNECVCQDSKFEPVCSEDGVTMFFSPCSAGCKKSETIFVEGNPKGVVVFGDCNCVAEAALTLNTSTDQQWWNKQTSPVGASSLPHPSGSALSFSTSVKMDSAIDGFCPADCDGLFYLTLGAMSIISLLGSSTRVGSVLISLRAVDPADKSASLVIMVSLLSMFGFLPSPLIIGKLLDDSCSVWGENCGEKTSCLLYDNVKMKRNISIFVGIFVFIATLLDIGAWWHCKDLRIFDDEEKEDATVMSPTPHIQTQDNQKKKEYI